MRYWTTFASSLCCVLLLLTGCQPKGVSDGEAEQTESNPIQAQKAVAGVGKEGQKLRAHSDTAKIISGPFSALLNVKQKVALEIQVKQAVDLFRATEGRFPSSHEEFIQKCVQANRIQLPELPPGAVYHFNSEKGELWVYPEEEVPSD